ncbi:PAS domain-containing sensor histidine kinase [Sphingomonas sp. DG1-23]|uniref:sensor histidine kinase n=1 Tax=Sphingomonas sp. DG1-23 TaxID=3068316 RepID=UPI00273F6DC5|nr:PAS domain-containing sensor histidine kinase [Sphingomonas sp. DG1-23]MDP5280710.1 PAS domain-containing sensor histidine kinase [Sphingomonas sp. DG1-23]
MPENVYDLIATMFKGARQPVLIKGEDYRYVFLSDQACKLIAVPLEELVGKTDYDFLPPAEADGIRAMDMHILETGAERLFEEEITGQDGSLRTLVTHKRRVTVPVAGRPTNLVIAEIDDVTELRNAEQVLRASEEHHRSLIELHPQTPWVANARGEVIEIGREWEQVSGRSVADACGHGWADSVHPEDLAHVTGSWAESVRTRTRLDLEYRILNGDGNFRWYRCRAAPRIDASGEVRRWYGLLEDVHDRQTAFEALIASERRLRQHRDDLEKIVETRTAEVKQKNSELARLLEQEREVNALQRRFVAMVSHEFRTPLTIIDAAAQRLARVKETPTHAYLAEKSVQIKGSVARMVELMESILAAGRLQTGVIDINKKTCSLADIVQSCVKHRQEVCTSHRIHADLSGLPAEVHVDPRAMERVFGNLLSNAIKYAPRAPDIYVRGWVDDATLHISVRDTGIGIDEEDLARLFEPYFRAQSAAGIAGTGIGLNIVREIIGMHGGQISVASQSGQGSTFTVSLPLDNQSPEIQEAA